MSKLFREFTCEGKTVKQTHLDLFEWLADRPDGNVNNLKTFVIFCTPRCGSTLFSDTLSRTGLIGWCEEWLNYEYFAAFQRVMGLQQTSFPVYYDFVKRKSVEETGVFSLKCHIGQLAAMHKDFEFTLNDIAADYSIYLYRKDKVAQAVSLSKAIATDKFRHNEEGKEGKFDLLNICDSLRVIMSQDKSFNLAISNRVDKEYAYEEFDGDRSCFDETLVALGKTPPYDYTTTMKKQRDEESESYKDMFVDFITGDY